MAQTCLSQVHWTTRFRSRSPWYCIITAEDLQRALWASLWRLWSIGKTCKVSFLWQTFLVLDPFWHRNNMKPAINCSILFAHLTGLELKTQPRSLAFWGVGDGWSVYFSKMWLSNRSESQLFSDLFRQGEQSTTCETPFGWQRVLLTLCSWTLQVVVRRELLMKWF